MKKLLIPALTILATLGMTARAESACMVSLSSAPVNNHRTLPSIISDLNNLSYDANCQNSEVGYDQAIKFIVEGYCKQHSAYCDASKWTPGIAYKSSTGHATITLNQAINLELDVEKILVGNTDYHDSYGLLLLDARSYTAGNGQGVVAQNIFSCPKSGTDNWQFRNMVILTKGVTKTDLLNLDCVGQYNNGSGADDLYVCDGDFNPNISPGQPGWCRHDIDADGFVDINDAGNDCADGNMFIHPGSSELPANVTDEDCDGLDGGSEITAYPPAISLSAGVPFNLALMFKNFGGYKKDAVITIDSNPNFTLVGASPALSSSGTSVNGTLPLVSSSALTPGTYTIKVRATSKYNTIVGVFQYSSWDSVDITIGCSSGSVELCGDNTDNDCDGQVDEGFTNLGQACSAGVGVCKKSGNYVCSANKMMTSCNATPLPVGSESVVCDGLDNDCDGVTDELCQDESDPDGDGYCANPINDGDGVCDNVNEKDCVDTDAAINPGEVEVCGNGKDDDCNAASSDTCVVVEDEIDNDQDGYCINPINDGDGICDNVNEQDCLDTDAAVNPGQNEVCGNGKDDDCNAATLDTCVVVEDEIDNDQDGYCINPKNDGDGFCDDINDRDCSDADPAINPGTSEVCGNGKDDDCDILTPDDCDTPTGCSNGEDPRHWFLDSDGDSYGATPINIFACEAPDEYVARPGDCNDVSSAINPVAEEICDGVDNNCDGNIDIMDVDGDSFSSVCLSDCNDADDDINPKAKEICGNGIDEDCDGKDGTCGPAVCPDGKTPLTFFRDADKDGFGDRFNTTSSCTQPVDYQTNSSDCDDNTARVNPGAEEICGDDIDNNCDSFVDAPACQVTPPPGGSERFFTGGAAVGGCRLSTSRSLTVSWPHGIMMVLTVVLLMIMRQSYQSNRLK